MRFCVADADFLEGCCGLLGRGHVGGRSRYRDVKKLFVQLHTNCLSNLILETRIRTQQFHRRSDCRVVFVPAVWEPMRLAWANSANFNKPRGAGNPSFKNTKECAERQKRHTHRESAEERMSYGHLHYACGFMGPYCRSAEPWTTQTHVRRLFACPDSVYSYQISFKPN